ncbi:hypothetical protein WNY37_04735 [Henriciella sp. AS95]|uniref:carboxylate--amine ligase n=1 Tax=Henriciella sp. AS95 TaxID=3135782 RepID=UPI003179153E
MSQFDSSTPVILLGGRENAVAVARNFGRKGIRIIASGLPGCRSMNSRYTKESYPVPDGMSASSYWRELLLSAQLDHLKGAIIFPFCDESLAFMETHRDLLAEHYLVEEFVPELRRIMLDKQATLKLAREVDVPAPRYWEITSNLDVQNIREEITFPVMVKPLDSYAFSHEFGRKLFIIHDSFDEVVEKVALARSKGHEVMVVEMIPGPDDLLSSYYTYRTAEGVRLFDYTKSVIRRWPLNRGGTCFHQSEWLPETADIGKKLFDRIGWQGFGNVEFKRDTRDGKLKIIEVNARFTAAHRLVTASGAPVDEMIYCHMTGQPVPTFTTYNNRLRMWYPIRDFMALRELSGLGRLGFTAWLKSVFAQKFVLPYFSFTDPMPSLAETGANISRLFGKIAGVFKRAERHADSKR